MNINKSRSRAFTLVELMVVVAIIALLTGIVMTNFGTSRGKARDAKRVSDIGQLQLTLELYFDRCNSYPTVSGTLDINLASSCSTNVGTVTLSDFISQIPRPPTGTTQTIYEYKPNTSRTDYVLKAKLESYSEIVKDGLGSGAGSGTGWPGSPSMVCSNSQGSTDYCVGPK